MSRKKKTEGVFDHLWALFSSVKLTVVVLLLLAVTSIIGTLIPQNQPLDYYYMRFGDVLFKLVNGFNLFDMYHSWWFRLLILILSMNLTVCSMDRLSSVWKIVRKKPEFDLARFRKYKGKQEFAASGSTIAKQEHFKALVSRKFGACQLEKNETGFVIFSEKGRATRLGVYVVHASVLFLLLGSMLGSLFGFEGSINIPVGESSNQVELRNSTFNKTLDFKIRCDDFQMTQYDNGAPKEYRSDLTLIENGKDVLTKTIIVNDPLRYKGINIFQSSYGTIAGSHLSLSFTSKKSGMVYDKKVSPNVPVELPENLGTFTLVDHVDSYGVMGQDIGECYIGKITSPGNPDQDVVLSVQYKSFDKMRHGPVAVTLVDFDKKYYTGLQVTKDPGVYLVYLGFILMVVGCYIAFFMSHQSLCVEVVKTNEDSCQVMVYGNANKNRMGMAMTIKKIASLLKKL